MKALSRNLDSASFPTKFTGVGKETMELNILTQTRDKLAGTRQKYSYLSWRTAKDGLIKESHGKCAYCEANFSSVAYGDVEHFRPKSIYWWLAYAYINYAPSCQLCNQKYKGKRFPIDGVRQVPPVNITATTTDRELTDLAGTLAPDLLDANLTNAQQYQQNHDAEQILSLDPYLDDPTLYFAYENNDELREVNIIPLSNTVERQVESCIRLFGLNRKELLNLRWKALYDYRIHREYVETGDNPRHQLIAQKAIEMMSAADAEFCGMINYFQDKPVDYIDLSQDMHAI